MRKLIFTGLCLCIAAGTATGDWNPGGPYKMHFPQLPDENGWGVEFSAWIPQLADDWQCTHSGEVDDIHLWYAWEGDYVGVIEKVQLGIWSNDLSGDYSKPGTRLWGYRDFFPTDFTTRYWDTGEQGWYDPVNNNWKYPDHLNIYQLNIVDISDPFYQEQGEIYWLSVCFFMGDPNHAGWKAADVDLYPEPYTGTNFMDNAAYMHNGSWHELVDPITYESLDLAFVITPEPATVVLLGLSGLMLCKRKR